MWRSNVSDWNSTSFGSTSGGTSTRVSGSSTIILDNALANSVISRDSLVTWNQQPQAATIRKQFNRGRFPTVCLQNKSKTTRCMPRPDAGARWGLRPHPSIHGTPASERGWAFQRGHDEDHRLNKCQDQVYGYPDNCYWKKGIRIMINCCTLPW